MWHVLAGNAQGAGIPSYNEKYLLLSSSGYIFISSSILYAFELVNTSLISMMVIIFTLLKYQVLSGQSARWWSEIPPRTILGSESAKATAAI